VSVGCRQGNILPYAIDGARFDEDATVRDMFAVTIRLRGVAPVTAETAHSVRSVILSAALPGDGLEHVYVQLNGPDADVVLFLLSPGLVRAEATAARLVTRAREAGLVGWETLTCQVELIAPFAEAALPPDDR
jgi:hypothetical protein